MCFNINFKKDPQIYTINNVLKEYRKSFQDLTLAGPTKIYPLIKKVVDNIKSENNPLLYHILLILTDGIFCDIQDTIDTIDILVEGSFLPLSVIIIGIGNDHFRELEIDDTQPIIDSKGVKSMRNCIQSAVFNNFKKDPTKLAEFVLEEIPRQLIEYYTLNSLYPNNLYVEPGTDSQKDILNN